MNLQQRLTKLEQATTSQNIDLAGLIKVEHNADGTATLYIGENKNDNKEVIQNTEQTEQEEATDNTVPTIAGDKDTSQPTPTDKDNQKKTPSTNTNDTTTSTNPTASTAPTPTVVVPTPKNNTTPTPTVVHRTNPIRINPLNSTISKDIEPKGFNFISSVIFQ